jgi:thioredoxin
MITEINSDALATMLTTNSTVLLDVWAPWCGPCKQLKPEIEKVANQYTGRATVVTMNADDNPEISRSYSISGLPTLMFFKDGQLVDRFAGFQSAHQIGKRLETIL